MEEKFFQGIGLGFSLIIVGITICFIFPNKYMFVIATLLIGLGISGLGIELDRLQSTKNNTNIFLGFTFLLIGVVILLLFNNLLTKILFLLLLMIGIFGLIQGFLGVKYQSSKNAKDEKNMAVIDSQKIKLYLSYLFAVTGFLADITTIIVFLRS